MTPSDLKGALEQMLSGEMNETSIIKVLTEVEANGVGPQELAVGVDVMRAHMTKVDVPKGAIDIVGTGGTGLKTLSISTAAAIVTAACGIPVAKHGNKGASSPTGTADTLSQLGVNITMTPERAASAVNDIGIGFLYAPSYHPALRHVGPARRAIGSRTLFNRLGPLCNPGEVDYMLVGSAERSLVPAMAKALKPYVRRAMVVSGHDGLDEITTTAPTDTYLISSAPEQDDIFIKASEHWNTSADPAALKGGDPKYNAARLTALLEGQKDAYRDIVLVNASEALWIAGQDERFAARQDAFGAAVNAIDSGAAKAKLAQLAEYSHG